MLDGDFPKADDADVKCGRGIKDQSARRLRQAAVMLHCPECMDLARIEGPPVGNFRKHPLDAGGWIGIDVTAF